MKLDTLKRLWLNVWARSEDRALPGGNPSAVPSGIRGRSPQGATPGAPVLTPSTPRLLRLLRSSMVRL